MFTIKPIDSMYAVIDLGSNSFHLLIAEYTGCHFSVVDRCSKKIQLADGLTRNGQLTQAAIERGLDCLRLFKEILSQHAIQHLQVIATQALRQATNAQHFIQQARDLGFTIEVISGRREAELVYRGICDPLPARDGNRLVIDIGGASTEIAVGNGQDILFAQSLPMGCVSWRDRFFAEGIEYGRRGIDAKNAAYATLKPLIETLSRLDWSEAYASSGSAKMLSTIALANGWTQGEINKRCIDDIEEAISRVKHHSAINLKGLKLARQDLLAPGVSIMGTIMEHLTIDTVIYSKSALREGILSEISTHRVGYRLDEQNARLMGTQ